MGFRLGELGGFFTTSMPVPSATASNALPNLSSLSRMRYFGPSPHGVASRSCCVTQASVGQRVTLEVHDFTRAVVHDKEREDGAKERVVELKEVACSKLAGMVF